MINKLEKEEEDREMKEEKINARSTSRCDGKEKVLVPARLIMYKDCRKNHAANIGRYAVDGCCEFMAAGDAGSPGAFLCAACNCHRNFHRKVVIWGHETSSSGERSSMSATSK